MSIQKNFLFSQLTFSLLWLSELHSNCRGIFNCFLPLCFHLGNIVNTVMRQSQTNAFIPGIIQSWNWDHIRVKHVEGSHSCLKGVCLWVLWFSSAINTVTLHNNSVSIEMYSCTCKHNIYNRLLRVLSFKRLNKIMFRFCHQVCAAIFIDQGVQ